VLVRETIGNPERFALVVGIDPPDDIAHLA
jgi:hypothetical protein